MKKFPLAFTYGLVTCLVESILLLLAIYITQKNSINTVLSSIAWVIFVCFIPAVLTGGIFAVASKNQARRSLVASKTSTANFFIAFICFNVFIMIAFFIKPAFLGSPASIVDAIYQNLGLVLFASLTTAFVSLLTAHLFLSLCKK